MVRISVTATFIASLIGLASATPLRRDNSLPTMKLGKLSGSLKDVVNKDEARLTRYHTSNFGNLKASASSSGSGDASTPVINQVDSYIAEVKVGSQTFNLVVDTGSSNLWVGATTKYKPGSTSKDTGKSVSVSYGSGSFSGEEFTDTVTVGSTTVKGQSVGVASTAQGFTGVDGIIGFGPVDLTANTVNGASSVPTFMDNLLKAGTIQKEILGISFAPEKGSDSNDSNGELTFGGIDSSKFTGKMTYVPLQGQYWGINVDGITYNGKSIGSANQAIVDTGTTLIYIPTDAFTAFSKATGGTTDQTSGLLSFTKQPTENIVFSIGGTDFALTPDQYLVPKDQYANNQLSGNNFFSWIGDGGSSSPGFILGMKFLENYYSVYDTTNSQVGLATSALVSGGGSSSGGGGSSSSGSGSSSTGTGSSSTGTGSSSTGTGSSSTGTGSSSTGTGSSSTGSSSSSSGSSSTGLGDGSSSSGDGSSSTGFGDGSSSTGFGDGSSSTGFGDGSSSTGFGDGSSSSGFGDGSSSTGFGGF